MDGLHFGAPQTADFVIPSGHGWSRFAGAEEFETLRLALAAAEARADVAEAELAVARAKASDDQAQIAHLKLQIAKLQRQLFGPHAERTPSARSARAAVGGAGGERQ